MRPLSAVEGQVAADRGAGLADRVVGPEIDLLVFDRAPHVGEPYASGQGRGDEGLTRSVC